MITQVKQVDARSVEVAELYQTNVEAWERQTYLNHVQELESTYATDAKVIRAINREAETVGWVVVYIREMTEWEIVKKDNERLDRVN